MVDDCDDMNASINPDQIEIMYNGIDDDCNPETLDDDLDQDGFDLVDDCDDNNHTVYPDAPELCDEIDNNCNEAIDEGLPTLTYYLDNDNDGYGDDSSAIERCAPPDGYIETGNDCDDSNPSINPDAIDIPNNGIDEDCDGEDLISAVNDIAFSDLKLYPNPFNDVFTIEQNENRKLQVEIMDITGRRIYSGVLTSRTNQVALGELKSGVYILQIADGDKVAYFKVVKE